MGLDSLIVETGLSRVIETNEETGRVAVVLGLRGTGKKLLTVALAGIMKNELTIPIQQRLPRVYSNFDVRFADIKDSNIHELIVKRNDITHGTLAWDLDRTWDEIGDVRTGEVVSKDSLLVQVRARGIDVVASTSQVPSGFMMTQCDYLMRPKLVKQVDDIGYQRTALYVQVWNWNGSKTGEPMIGTELSELKDIEPWSKFKLYGVDRFFDQYRTA